MKWKTAFGLVVLLMALGGMMNSASGIEHKMRELDRQNQIKKKFWPSRLGDKEDRRCEACEEKEAKARMDYLSRVLADDSSDDYLKQVRQLVLEDERFVAKCWDRLSSKEVELFFTINNDGRAEDLASFPKKVMSGCLKKRVKKLEFPLPEQDEHIWLVLSEF